KATPTASLFASALNRIRENELAADLAWIDTLLYYGDGLIRQTSMPDVGKLIDQVVASDPRFRRPYMWGSYSLVFRNRLTTSGDYEDSARLLRKAIAVFPDDWELHWALGLRLYFDIKRPDKDEQARIREEGAAMIERAMHLPGAPQDLA